MRSHRTDDKQENRIGCEYPKMEAHENLCFQSQRRQSITDGTAETKEAVNKNKAHRPDSRYPIDVSASASSGAD